MSLHIINTLTAIVFFLSNITVYTKGDATMFTLLKSIKDTQELLDAYNDGDYVKTGIKLIDIKLKADPPEKGSAEEQVLLSCREYLQDIYPYYLKAHKARKNQPTIGDIRNFAYEETIDTLDSIIFEMGMSIDNLLYSDSSIKPSEWQKNMKKTPTDAMNESTAQLLNIFNNYTEQVVDAFSQTVDKYSLNNYKEGFISNREVNVG